LVELVYRDKKRRTFLEVQIKPKIPEKNFFEMLKSSDIGRSLEKVL